MHYLIVSAQYLPTAGGVERYTHNLASQLLRLGHSVSILTSSLPGQPPQESEDGGLTIWRLPAHLFLNGRFPVPRRGGAFARLAAQLWQGEYSFCLIQTRFYPLCLWAARQCRARGLPAMVLEHGTKHLSLDQPVLNIFAGWYEHLAMRRMRRYCQHFYGVSLACGQWLGHFGLSAAGVLYNAVNADEIAALAKAASFSLRAGAGLAPNVPVICFVGRLIKEKGIWELLQAFSILRGQYPSAVLAIAGSGPLQQKLQQALPPGAVFLGQLAYGSCLALMQQSDVFCLPTYSEGFASTVLEAAALGCYIVTTATGGSPELITGPQRGGLLAGFSPEEIAAALAAALKNPAARIAAGQAAQKAVQEGFTWQATAGKFVEISRGILNI